MSGIHVSNVDNVYYLTDRLPIENKREHDTNARTDKVVVHAHCDRFAVIDCLNVHIARFKSQEASKQ